jgi:hypothetical protein
MSPLEEVFLKVVREAEVQHALETGATVALTLHEGPPGGAAGTPGPQVTVRVAPGAPTAETPGGARYVLTWAQDESGGLHVSTCERAD